MSPEILALVVEGRRRQDLPDRIVDPAALTRIARIVLPVEVEVVAPDGE